MWVLEIFAVAFVAWAAVFAGAMTAAWWLCPVRTMFRSIAKFNRARSGVVG